MHCRVSMCAANWTTREMRRAKSAKASDSPSNRVTKRARLSKNVTDRWLYTSPKAHSYRGTKLRRYLQLSEKARSLS